MRNYTKINTGQSWDTIGGEIDRQLGAYPETNEIMYMRVPRTKHMYAAYILNASQTSPAIRCSDFIHAVPVRDLEETLNAESFPHEMPKKIRIIRPDRKRDAWGVFFQK